MPFVASNYTRQFFQRNKREREREREREKERERHNKPFVSLSLSLLLEKGEKRQMEKETPMACSFEEWYSSEHLTIGKFHYSTDQKVTQYDIAILATLKIT